MKGHEVQIAISEELFYVAMINLIMQGKYYSIPDYLVNEFDSISDKEFKEQITARYLFCRNLSIAIYDKRSVEKACELITTNKRFADMLDYHRGMLWIMTQKAKNYEEYLEIINQADKSMKSFGEDGEILCYKAEAIYNCGDKAGARTLFEKGVSRTRNGFLLHRAEILCDTEIPKGDISIKSSHYSPAGQLLIRFHNYCEDHNYQYYLVGRKNKDNSISLRDNYFEVAMTHDDIVKFKTALETSTSKSNEFYIKEQVHDNMDGLYGRIRLYDDKSCMIDIRDYAEHSMHCATISIYEIEKYGNKWARLLFETMYSSWMEDGAEQFEHKRRKIRTIAKCVGLAGRILSEPAKMKLLKRFRQHYFIITNNDFDSKESKLRIGANITESKALTVDDYIECGIIKVPVLWECEKKTPGTPIYTKRDLRYQIIDSERAYAEVMMNDEAELVACVQYQKEIDYLNRAVTTETKTINENWKRVKRLVKL